MPDTLIQALALITLLSFPALVIFFCIRIPALDKLGCVMLAFAAGIASSGLMDLISTSYATLDLKASIVPIQTQLSEVAIALAIPLLLFSVNIKKAFQLAGDTTKSMGLALLSVLLMSMILSWFFNGKIDELWQVAGMSVGAYTGGGPNMAAIKTAIQGDTEVFVTMTTYDILLSALYLLFIMSVAKPLFSKLLPPFQHRDLEAPDATENKDFDHLSSESAHAFIILTQRSNFKAMALSILCAGFCIVAGLGLSALFPETMQSTVTIIAITTVGLLLSLVPAIHRIKSSFQLGMYLILVFCFAMGSLTDLSVLTNLNGALFSYIGLLLVGALIGHAILCRWLKIDVDTFLITSSAAIMSVPFIPVIAGAIKNKAIILPGFAAAIIGYALGNYLGVFTAYAVKSIF